jgi:hypothetical protein
MSKGMLIMFAASLLSLGACGADLGDDVDAQDEDAVLEHRFGGQSRCNDADEDSDEGAGNGGSDSQVEAAKSEGRRRRGLRCGQKRDAGAPTHADEGTPRRDAGRPAASRDAGRGPIEATRDAGTPPPANTRDAGRVVVDDGDDDDNGGGGGPVIVDVDRDVINLPDGTVVRLDRSCPNYATPFAVTLPGCCLPAGSCGLSTHDIDTAGVPKGCFSYAQAKMLDPAFNLPAKSCSPN